MERVLGRELLFFTLCIYLLLNDSQSLLGTYVCFYTFLYNKSFITMAYVCYVHFFWMPSGREKQFFCSFCLVGSFFCITNDKRRG